MSGFITIPPSTNSSIFNPSYFTSSTSSSSFSGGSIRSNSIVVSDSTIADIKGGLHIRSNVSKNFPAGYRMYTAGNSSWGGQTMQCCLYVEGAGVAENGWYALSDRRLKKNIEVIGYDKASKLLEVKPVLYDWKYKKNGKRELGVIAQDLINAGLEDCINIIPNNDVEADTDDGAGFAYSVQYDRLTVYLLAILQKLNQDIAELKDSKKN